jgi:hypothetical protein
MIIIPGGLTVKKNKIGRNGDREIGGWGDQEINANCKISIELKYQPTIAN